MNNRKRVTLTFEIDDHDGYNDEAFMRHDFLGELSCCVNDPYADTSVMKVEDADVPREMTAQQYGDVWRKICKQHPKEPCVAGCPLGKLESLYCCSLPTKETIAIVEKWAKEHPERSGA